MKTKIFSSLLFLLAISIQAQVSTRLSDTIKSGTGSINLLKDISGAQLARQISSGGKLLFGIDLNENASGNESSKSIGVALQSLELTVTTTTGTYLFTNFATNSTAILSKAGSTELNTYHTLFGQIGSSQITSSTSSFDLSRYDDVIVLNEVVFTGQVLSATMNVQLLDTGNSRTSNDTFFDFSGGFEDLALLSPLDALTLENAGIGLADAPVGVVYTLEAPIITQAEVAPITESQTTTTTTTHSVAPAPTAPPAAPAPAVWLVLALCALLLASKSRRWGASTRTADGKICA